MIFTRKNKQAKEKRGSKYSPGDRVILSRFDCHQNDSWSFDSTKDVYEIASLASFDGNDFIYKLRATTNSPKFVFLNHVSECNLQLYKKSSKSVWN